MRSRQFKLLLDCCLFLNKFAGSFNPHLFIFCLPFYSSLRTFSRKRLALSWLQFSSWLIGFIEIQHSRSFSAAEMIKLQVKSIWINRRNTRNYLSYHWQRFCKNNQALLFNRTSIASRFRQPILYRKIVQVASRSPVVFYLEIFIFIKWTHLIAFS